MIDYIPNFLFKNKHFNTCFPTLFRKVNIEYQRERLETPDEDFLDIDWIKNNNNKLLILCHGLEGSSHSQYIKGMAKFFSDRSWDILAMNYRGCSGELNKKPYFYHSGFTQDLDFLVNINKKYSQIALVGFSLGANMILKYLGERNNYPKNLIGAAVVSPPCDMEGCSIKIRQFSNKIYTLNFLKSLKQKVLDKDKLYPGIYENYIDLKKLSQAKELHDFDEFFTAPLHGYRNAHDYYENNSSKKLLKNIKLPTFILMPLDDPIMSTSSYPFIESQKNNFITLETPKFGGHVGFAALEDSPYWDEKKIFEFLSDISINSNI